MPLFKLYKEDIQQVKKPTNIWFKEAETINQKIASTFGPYGMYKLTSDSDILSNGKDIIDNIELGPMAEPIIKSVTSQYQENKDGTTSLALLLSRLMIEAHNLTTDGLHMSNILSGYEKALDIAVKIVERNIRKIDKDDFKTLEEIIQHSIAGTIADKENIISTIRDAILFLKEPKEEDIAVLTEESGEGAEVIMGLKLDYNRIREDMPEEIENATIALLDKLTPRKTNIDMRINIASAELYSMVAKMEDKELKEYVDKLIDLGVKAVFVKDEIDPRIADMLARNNITAFEKIKEGDLKEIAKSTGAKLTSILSLSKEDLGFVGILDDSESEECIGGVCRT